MNELTIVFLDTDTLGDFDIAPFEELGTVKLYPKTDSYETLSRVAGADVVVTNKVVINREVIEKSALKLICIAATGTNNVDHDAAKKAGIPIRNVAGYSTDSVAQHTFATLLGLIGQIPYHDKFVKKGGYRSQTIFTHLDRPYFELKGKNIGIIGLGAIGRKVASIAEAFGAKVYYTSTSGQNKTTDYDRLELNELLTLCDVVSIHAPLNKGTQGLIGEKELQIMKTSSILINMGRGGIVDEQAVVSALRNDQISGAVLDVFEQEPPVSDQWENLGDIRDKLILSPHIAWASQEARATLMVGVLFNIKEELNV